MMGGCQLRVKAILSSCVSRQLLTMGPLSFLYLLVLMICWEVKLRRPYRLKLHSPYVFIFMKSRFQKKKGIVKSFYCEQSSFDSVLSVERYSAVVIRYWTREVVFVDGAAGWDVGPPVSTGRNQRVYCQRCHDAPAMMDDVVTRPLGPRPSSELRLSSLGPPQSIKFPFLKPRTRVIELVIFFSH